MKNLIFLFFMITSVSFINAQEVKSAFLTKMEVNWMNTEISDLQQTYTVIEKALAEKDGIDVGRNKTEIIKSITSLSSNSNIFYTKIMLWIDNEERANQRISDGPSTYNYDNRKKDGKSQEIVISQSDLQKFKSNLDALIKIKETLKATKYALHPQQENALANLKLVAEFLEIARLNNTIIQNSLRD